MWCTDHKSLYAAVASVKKQCNAGTGTFSHTRSCTLKIMSSTPRTRSKSLNWLKCRNLADRSDRQISIFSIVDCRRQGRLEIRSPAPQCRSPLIASGLRGLIAVVSRRSGDEIRSDAMIRENATNACAKLRNSFPNPRYKN